MRRAPSAIIMGLTAILAIVALAVSFATATNPTAPPVHWSELPRLGPTPTPPLEVTHAGPTPTPFGILPDRFGFGLLDGSLGYTEPPRWTWNDTGWFRLPVEPRQPLYFAVQSQFAESYPDYRHLYVCSGGYRQHEVWEPNDEAWRAVSTVPKCSMFAPNDLDWSTPSERTITRAGHEYTVWQLPIGIDGPQSWVKIAGGPGSIPQPPHHAIVDSCPAPTPTPAWWPGIDYESYQAPCGWSGDEGAAVAIPCGGTPEGWTRARERPPWFLDERCIGPLNIKPVRIEPTEIEVGIDRTSIRQGETSIIAIGAGFMPPGEYRDVATAITMTWSRMPAGDLPEVVCHDPRDADMLPVPALVMAAGDSRGTILCELTLPAEAETYDIIWTPKADILVTPSRLRIVAVAQGQILPTHTPTPTPSPTPTPTPVPTHTPTPSPTPTPVPTHTPTPVPTHTPTPLPKVVIEDLIADVHMNDGGKVGEVCHGQPAGRRGVIYSWISTGVAPDRWKIEIFFAGKEERGIFFTSSLPHARFENGELPFYCNHDPTLQGNRPYQVRITGLVGSAAVEAGTLRYNSRADARWNVDGKIEATPEATLPPGNEGPGGIDR